MNRYTVTTLKIICGLLIIWGGFKLQLYLWPTEQSSDIESTELPDTD